MRILNEETNTKENLPVSFVTDMISKGWDEVGCLREASAAIKEAYQGTTKVEDLMQDLMDAYLVFIGQLEQYLQDKENISAPTEETKDDEEKDETEAPAIESPKVKAPKPELPEADFNIEPIAEPAKTSPAASSDVAEPFEFFVDFDEPDMSQPALTDSELYDDNNRERIGLRG